MRGKFILIIAIVLALFTLLPYLPMYWVEESEHTDFDTADEDYKPPGIDSDGDGLYDFYEDLDGNKRLTDPEVVITDPYNFDSDSDSLNDGEEYSYWNDRYETQNYIPSWIRTTHPEITSEEELFDLYKPDGDLDGDGLINILDTDSDGDWVADGIEIDQGTDPANPWSDDSGLPDSESGGEPVDNDGDGIDDRWEDYHNVSDPHADPDGDGKSNLQEYLEGTDPNHPGESHDQLTGTESTINNFYGDDMDRIVFYVDPTNEARYWRLTAYDQYTATYGWSQKMIYNVTYPGDLDLPTVTEAETSEVQEFNITMWGSIRGYLPTALYTTSIDNVSLDSGLYPPSFVPLLYEDNANGFSSRDFVFDYKFTSLKYTFNRDNLESATSESTRLGTSPLYFYTDNPPTYNTNIDDLATTITIPLGAGASDYQKAVAVQEYLKENYVYDLNASFPNDTFSYDKIDYFLFTGKAGVCTHFASSFVLLCRYLDIPSRYVVGYALGELENGRRVVRAGHKHAWAEVYFDGYGWIQFEATPPNPGAGGGTGVDFDGVDDSISNGNGTGDGGGTLNGNNETSGLDTDGDGIPNSVDPDDDNDGLSDTEEAGYGTDPLKKDTDGDGLTDSDELDVYKTDPLKWDTDGDLLNDGDEINTHFTDPLDWDTDNGGVGDGSEIFNKKDPFDPEDDRQIFDMDGDGLDDIMEEEVYFTNKTNPDTDDDGILDGSEVYKYFTDPNDPDSDGDNITDGEEVTPGEDGYITSPNSFDTDSDGLGDWMEINIHNTDPTLFDTDLDGLEDGIELDDTDGFTTDPREPDTDNDGLKDGEEDRNKNGRVDSIDPLEWDDGEGIGETDPNKKDTDGGGTPDSTEVWNGYNPLDPADDLTILDTDNDGLSDIMENNIGTDPTHPDSDRDGLSDGEEVNTYHTDPNKVDSDGDTIKDSEEVHFGEDGYVTDPNNNDTDQDGLSDFQEIHIHKTDPTKKDTDGDGLNDGKEIKTDFNLTAPGTQGTNPLDPDTDNGGIKDGDEYNNGLNPLDPSDDVPPKDSDLDGIPDDAESIYGTNASDPDTDDDGLLDGEEVFNYDTDPLDPDSDDDLLGDHEEVNVGFDGYITNATNPDTDSDGLNDTEEYVEGTNPLKADTDNDALTDHEEVTTDLDPLISGMQTTDPLDQDTDGDDLKDGFELLNDFDNSTAGIQPIDPLDPDTDGGGANDGWEIFKGRNPLNPNDDISILDSDGDKLTDLEEMNTYFTNASKPDTDGDGLSDGEEVLVQNTDPLDMDSDDDNLTDGFEVKTQGIVNKYVTDPNTNDTDLDTLTDWEEIYLYSTDPTNRDTDGDGLTDDIEVGLAGGGRGPGDNTRSDPTNPDSDGDGMPDGWIDGWDFETRTTKASLKNGIMDVGEYEDANLNGKVDIGGWNNGDGPGETDPLDDDTDGGGALDGWEAVNGYDPLDALDDDQIKDYDKDGLSDHEENTSVPMTKWNDPDSDGDGLWDGYNIYFQGDQKLGERTGHNGFPTTNATNPDTDGDGLTDGGEVTGSAGKRTDPTNTDTDGDGLWDGQNHMGHLGELALHHPLQTRSTDPTLKDTDDDGLWDGLNMTFNSTQVIGEISVKTNPLKKDTDFDDLSDWVEVKIDRWPNTTAIDTTDPNNPDTDGGGVTDGIEVIRGTDPLNGLDDNDFGDTDRDGIENFKENNTVYDESDTDWSGDGDPDYITSWENPDSDGDGLSDGEEVYVFHTEPLLADTDHDGLDDYEEIMVLGTNASNPDTDGDGLTDLYELSTIYLNSVTDWEGDSKYDNRTDPLDPDTDGGGTRDGDEVDKGKNPLDKSDDVDKPIFKEMTITMSGLPDSIEKEKRSGKTNFTITGLVEDEDGDLLDDVEVFIYVLPMTVYEEKDLDDYDEETADFNIFEQYLASSVTTKAGKYTANVFCPSKTPVGPGNVAFARAAAFKRGMINYNTSFSGIDEDFIVYSGTTITVTSAYDNQTFSKGQLLDLQGYLTDKGGVTIPYKAVRIFYDSLFINQTLTDDKGKYSGLIDLGSGIGKHTIKISFDGDTDPYLSSSIKTFNIRINATITDITVKIDKTSVIVGGAVYVNGTVMAEGSVPVDEGMVTIEFKEIGGGVVSDTETPIYNGKFGISYLIAEASFYAGDYTVEVSTNEGLFSAARNNSNTLTVIGKSFLDKSGVFSASNTDEWVEQGSGGRPFTGYLEDNRGRGLAGRRINITFTTVAGGSLREDITVITRANGAFDFDFPVRNNEPLGPITVTATYGYSIVLDGRPQYLDAYAEVIIKVQNEVDMELTETPDEITHLKDFSIKGRVWDERTDEGFETANLIVVSLDGKELGRTSADSDGDFVFTHILSKFHGRGRRVIEVEFVGDDMHRPATTSFSVEIWAKSSIYLATEGSIRSGEKFNATVQLKVDGGGPISGAEVQIKFDGRTYDVYTDGSGKAKVELLFPAGKSVMTLKAVYAGDEGDHVLESDADKELISWGPGSDPGAIGDAFGIIAIIFIVLAILGAGYYFFMWRRRHIKPLEDVIEAALYSLETDDKIRKAIFECYREMSEVLVKYKFLRRDSQTPWEFEKAIYQALPQVQEKAVNNLTELFVEARYSDHRMRPKARTKAINSLKRIRASLQSS